MNKRGFIDLDDINPAYVLLGAAGGLIGYVVTSFAWDGKLLPFLAGIGSFVTTYIYLAFTD